MTLCESCSSSAHLRCSALIYYSRALMKPSALLPIALCFFLITQMSSDWLLSIEAMRVVNTCTLSNMSFWVSLLLSSTRYLTSWTLCSFSWIICCTSSSVYPRRIFCLITLYFQWHSFVSAVVFTDAELANTLFVRPTEHVQDNIVLLADPVVQFDWTTVMRVSSGLQLCSEPSSTCRCRRLHLCPPQPIHQSFCLSSL